VHFANVGGMWQEVVFGFAGLASALNADTLTFNPCLPAEIRKISFRLMWKGSRFEVRLTPDELELTNLSDTDVRFAVRGRTGMSRADSTIRVRY
jgi:trehalose/maltose hydrolase-like predicted phosphorylase